MTFSRIEMSKQTIRNITLPSNRTAHLIRLKDDEYEILSTYRSTDNIFLFFEEMI